MPNAVPDELRRSRRFVVALTVAEEQLLREHAERVGEKPAVLAREYLFEGIRQVQRAGRSTPRRRAMDPFGL